MTILNDLVLSELTKQTHDKERIIRDERPEMKGFALRVRRGRLEFVYIYSESGKRRYAPLGYYPETSCKEAEGKYNRRVGKRREIPRGAGVVQEEGEREALSLLQLLARYRAHLIAKHQAKPEQAKMAKPTSLGTAAQAVNGYLRYVDQPDMPACDVDPDVLENYLEYIAFTLNYKSRANQEKDYIRAMYNLAIKKRWCPLRSIKINPAYGIEDLKPRIPRDRVLRDGEIAKLASGIVELRKARVSALTRKGGREMSLPMSLALLAELLSAQRGIAVRHMRLRDIMETEGQPVWVIPKAYTKHHKHDEVIPMPPLLHELVMAAGRFSSGLRDVFGCSQEQDWVFASTFNPDEPTHGQSYARCTQAIARHCEIDHFTPHDLRRTHATTLSRFGCDDMLRERILSHKTPYDMKLASATYNIWNYLPQKREWMTRFNDHVAELWGDSYHELLDYTNSCTAKVAAHAA